MIDVGALPLASGRLGLPTGERILRFLGVALPIVWAAYALFDRAFAWVHVPGVPVFTGEVLVAGTLVVALMATPHVREAFTTGPMAALAAFLIWGLARTLPGLGEYGLDTVRDAAIWYYAAFALLVIALVHLDPDRPQAWAVAYGRFLPVLLVWSPVAMILALVFTEGGPRIPDSDVPILSHKPGNIAAHLAVAVAALWLVPGVADDRRRRLVLTGGAVAGLAIVGSQNRGGLVAAGLGIAVAWLFADGRVRLLLQAVGLVVLLLVVAWALDLKVPGDRDVSVTQLVTNVLSLTGEDKDGPGALQGTVKWRGELWDRIMDETVRQDRLAFGWGFGPNLGDQFFGEDGGGDLRSPHNSHLNIVARMGLLGVGAWILLWATWFWAMFHGRRHLQAIGDTLGAGLVEVAVVGVIASLVNAYFDPSIESAQASILVWTLFGLGVAMVARAHRAS